MDNRSVVMERREEERMQLDGDCMQETCGYGTVTYLVMVVT